MGIFSSILEKLGLGGKKDDEFGSRPYEQAPGKAPTAPPAGGSGGGGGGGMSRPAPTAPPARAAVRTVDIEATLEKMAAASDQKLNWKTSIVDLLKLMDLDSSLAARKQLADELGAPESLADGSAEMNIWLHKEVLKKIAANGGVIPKHMLD